MNIAFSTVSPASLYSIQDKRNLVDQDTNIYITRDLLNSFLPKNRESAFF